MGMFDSVRANCSACGKKGGVEFQTKAGDCVLRDYSPESVPVGIADDLRGRTAWCCVCDEEYRAEPFDLPRVTVVRIVPTKS